MKVEKRLQIKQYEVIKLNSCQEQGKKYPVRKCFSFVRGDVFAFSVRVTERREPQMLDYDGRMYFAVKPADGEIAVSKAYGSSDQDEDGFVSVVLLPEETAALPPGEYDYEAEFRFSETNVITALRGTVTVNADMITDGIRPDGSSAEAGQQ